MIVGSDNYLANPKILFSYGKKYNLKEGKT